MPTIDRTLTTYHGSTSSHLHKIGQYTGPASYVTGGDAFTAANLGMGRVDVLLFELAVNGAGTVRGIQYDTVNGLARWIVLDTGSEVANGTDLSGFSARFLALGR